jgi:hypothetical protein
MYRCLAWLVHVPIPWERIGESTIKCRTRQIPHETFGFLVIGGDLQGGADAPAFQPFGHPSHAS